MAAWVEDSNFFKFPLFLTCDALSTEKLIRGSWWRWRQLCRSHANIPIAGQALLCAVLSWGKAEGSSASSLLVDSFPHWWHSGSASAATSEYRKAPWIVLGEIMDALRHWLSIKESTAPRDQTLWNRVRPVMKYLTILCSTRSILFNSVVIRPRLQLCCWDWNQFLHPKTSQSMFNIYIQKSSRTDLLETPSPSLWCFWYYSFFQLLSNC